MTSTDLDFGLHLTGNTMKTCNTVVTGCGIATGPEFPDCTRTRGYRGPDHRETGLANAYQCYSLVTLFHLPPDRKPMEQILSQALWILFLRLGVSWPGTSNKLNATPVYIRGSRVSHCAFHVDCVVVTTHNVVQQSQLNRPAHICWWDPDNTIISDTNSKRFCWVLFVKNMGIVFNIQILIKIKTVQWYGVDSGQRRGPATGLRKMHIIYSDSFQSG